MPDGVSPEIIPSIPRDESPKAKELDLPGVWQKFSAHLENFGIAREDLERFGGEYTVALDTAEKLNNGEEAAGFHFEKNILRYHSFDYTRYVVARTIQLIPGFLKVLEKRGVDVRAQFPKIKGLVFSAIFHDIGYLKQPVGDEAYLNQAELYFDHVDRSMAMAPQIMQNLGFDLRSEDVV